MQAVETRRDEVAVTGTAMASRLSVRLVVDDHTPREQAQIAAYRALEVFHHVDRTCTRFSPDSDLMRVNANPQSWTAVDPTCYDAITAAYWAYRRTRGRFDPRVLDDLVRLGYDKSLRFGPPSERDATALTARPALPEWTPEFRHATREVRVGPHAVDLGGIGKGLAVRWAAAELRGHGVGHLVEAGGDVHCAGVAPDGGAWRVAVEAPSGSSDPLAVLAVHDAAVATSSVRIRSWSVAGQPVHHLLDPATGQPGGAGLAAVTVVDDDPATAETWSKVLFLAGKRGVATTAEHYGIAAMWVDEAGTVTAAPAMQRHVLWSAS